MGQLTKTKWIFASFLLESSLEKPVMKACQLDILWYTFAFYVQLIKYWSLDVGNFCLFHYFQKHGKCIHIFNFFHSLKLLFYCRTKNKFVICMHFLIDLHIVGVTISINLLMTAALCSSIWSPLSNLEFRDCSHLLTKLSLS